MSILFDANKEAIINPFGKCEVKIPKIAISCYTEKVTEDLIQKYSGIILCEVSKTKIYKINYQEKEIMIFTSPVGASWATMVLEDLISLGLKTVIYFGSCGVLDSTNEYEILIPVKSRREEGTSYHYIKNNRYIDINPKYKDNFIKILTKNQMNFRLCQTWTTDAPYRETKRKIRKFIKEGITTVEMEASALAAIGIYRNIDVFIFFYAADSLAKLEWDKRCLGEEKIDKKMIYAMLALDLAVSIMK